MGGLGAKSRRRQQRETQQGKADDDYGPRRQDNNNNNKALATKSRKKVQISNTATTKKTIKVKKPKHLKRKLDALEETEETSEKERLVQEIQQFEENKLKFRKSPTVRKKTKQDEHLKRKEGSSDLLLHSRDDGRECPSKKPKREQDAASLPSSSKEQLAQKLVPRTNSLTTVVGVDNNDSDDESVALPEALVRQRGKRRRGRKDTSQKVLELQHQEATKTGSTISHDALSKNSATHIDDKAKSLSLDNVAENKRQKTTADDNRYCKGRKPVTDFAVGQCYTGKVVYVKPFGVFIDIGCHSDAFCHVSRLQDEYVESATSLFQPGDEIKGARVIEIDRLQKRITVSLQSESLRDKELQSIEARKGRLGKRGEKKTRVLSKTGHKMLPNQSSTTLANPSSPADTTTRTNPVVSDRQEDLPSVDKKSKPGGACSIENKNESEMTPAELKRARKLARRAARREEQETMNGDRQ